MNRPPHWAVTGLAAPLLISLLVVAGYERWVRQPRTPQWAVVDLAQLVQEQQRRVGQALVKPGQTELERARILLAAERFGPRLLQQLARVQRDCQCILLTKQAVLLARPLRDWTPIVRQRLAGPT